MEVEATPRGRRGGNLGRRQEAEPDTGEDGEDLDENFVSGGDVLLGFGHEGVALEENEDTIRGEFPPDGGGDHLANP
jgi:hypothetical protein